MRSFYVIITSWNDVLERVASWTDNPYVAISYFKEYKEMDKNSKMVIVKASSALELSKILMDDGYVADVSDLLDSHLLTKTSKDGRCYAIYRERFSALFSDDYMDHTARSASTCYLISAIMMGVNPILKYISLENPNTLDLITNLIVHAYAHTSIKRLMSNNRSVNSQVSDFIDVVYFWKFLNSSSSYQLSSYLEDLSVSQPIDAVFIDSN